MKDKKKYVLVGCIILLIIICIIKFIPKGETKEIAVENEIVEDNNIKPEETKVTGYHLITYNQSANKNSYIKNLYVAASNPDKVRFVIGNIDENNYVIERLSFEVECKKGDNKFNLLDKKYFLKQGEYLFMDVFGQDILFTKSDSKVESLVESEENKDGNRIKITKSNYILPFKYSLEEVKDYNMLVIGNDITTKDGGRGLNSTEDDLDYYSLTKTRISEDFENIKSNKINAKNWEQSTISESKENWINQNLSEKVVKGLDLVLIQLGDNLDELGVDNLEDDITVLIQHIRKFSPGAQFIWIGPWNAKEEVDLKLRPICERLNLQFVEIKDLYTDEYKSQVNENVLDVNTNAYSTQEVFYPNNEAMQIISNRIIEKLDFNF